MTVPFKDQAEIEAAADVLLYPGGGGIAIWVRIDELEPRAAVRWRGKDVDPAEAVTHVACLAVAIERLCTGLEKTFDLPAGQFMKMVSEMVPVVRDRTASNVKVRPSSPTHHKPEGRPWKSR